MENASVRVTSMRKAYGDFVAVEDVSFAVEPGEIFGVLGPNGAGKSTILECLEGLRRPSGGTVRVMGLDPARESRRLRDAIGVQLQTSGLPATMRVEEAMRFFCAYHGIHPRLDLIERLGLAAKARAQYGELSTGLQRRLALALAVAHVPEAAVLLLPALTALAHIAVASVAIAATAPLLFGAPLPGNWPGFVASFLLAALAHAGIGVLIAVISENTRATILWSQLVFLPSMMLGGLMVPTEAIPGGLAQVAKILPTSYGMAAMRGLGYGDAAAVAPWASLAVLAVGGLVAIGLAIWLFRWDVRSDGGRRHPIVAVLVVVPYLLGMVLL